jgi:hypothetical protein
MIIVDAITVIHNHAELVARLPHPQLWLSSWADQLLTMTIQSLVYFAHAMSEFESSSVLTATMWLTMYVSKPIIAIFPKAKMNGSVPTVFCFEAHERLC